MAVRGPRGARVRPPTRGGGRGGRVDTFKATDGRDIVFNGPDGWLVDAPQMWWDGGGSWGDEAGPVWGNPPRGATDGTGAASIPSVRRCTSLICDTIPGLPWYTVKDRQRFKAPTWVMDPQLKRGDGRSGASDLMPAWRFSFMEFWSTALVSLVWWGELFLWTPLRDANGAPKAPIWILHPSAVDLDERTGTYSVDGYEFGPDELIVVRGFTRPGSLRGLGVVDSYAGDFAFMTAARSFADNLLRRGVPNGYLQVTAPDLTQEAADKLKATWWEAHGGTKKQIAVLNATTNFVPIQFDAQAVELIELRRYSLLDVALMFGIPPYMLGLPSDSSTYANVENRMTEFGQFTLLPWTRRLEDAIDNELPLGTELRINLDALRRADTATRYAAHKTGLDAGFLTVDDVREMEDLPDLPEGNAA
ncbi:phage portal protein [Streptomyces sp. NPDC102340]|uniref:phage portal protein n=1 Tax=unclassified Streptomyces TaxID=2593676 RepID=UPI0037F31299